MCYDISFSTNVQTISDYFESLILDSQLDLDFGPASHIQGVSVFGEHPIVYINRDDLRPHLRLMGWSCIEFYQKDMPDSKKRNGMLNIRAERILDDPKSYWFKIRNRRCLVPMTGIFEHRGIKGWKNKVPYHVAPKDQSRLFFLPGLYSVAELPDKATGEMVKHWTFGIITRAANALMRNIHNDGDNRHRMPLFLPLNETKEFLSEELTPERYKQLLAYEMPPTDLAAHPTWTIRTPKIRPDGKEKHEPWAWEKLPALGELDPDNI